MLHDNPRLDFRKTKDWIPHPLKTTADGLKWAFYSRAKSLFVKGSRVKDTKSWRNEYLGAGMDINNFEDRFEEDEMLQQFDMHNERKRYWVENSGHIARYNESGGFANVYLTFFIYKLWLT